MQRYAITNRTSPEQLRAWIHGAVEWVQLREKHLQPEPLENLARSLSPLFAGTGTRFLINGLSAERALACGASGVHLPGNFTAESIAEAHAAGALVTVSCHTLEEVEAARSAHATAILWAPVFGKDVDGSRVTPATGLPALADACRIAAPVPVFALGGITPENAASCTRAGASGVAGIRLFAEDGWKLL